MYARLVDKNDETNVSENVLSRIDKIDKTPPTITSNLKVTSYTRNSVTLSISASDSSSGLGQIEWVCDDSLSSLETLQSEGSIKGDESVSKSKIYFQLVAGCSYSFYAIVRDVAGNSVRCPTSGAVSQTLKTGTTQTLTFTPSTLSSLPKDLFQCYARETLYVEFTVTLKSPYSKKGFKNVFFGFTGPYNGGGIAGAYFTPDITTATASFRTTFQVDGLLKLHSLSFEDKDNLSKIECKVMIK